VKGKKAVTNVYHAKNTGALELKFVSRCVEQPYDVSRAEQSGNNIKRQAIPECKIPKENGERYELNQQKNVAAQLFGFYDVRNHIGAKASQCIAPEQTKALFPAQHCNSNGRDH
jgi:hypothetical protein